MKKRILLAAPLLAAGLQTATAQTAMAQKMVVRMDDNSVTKFDVTQVVDVTFVEEAADTHGVTNGHEWVDLGLPSGTLWATCNVGATSPEKYGAYFAWGETVNKGKFNWSNYKWCNGESNSLTKYCSQNDYSYGTIDNKTELDIVDDAATANWGIGWRMPSDDQIDELINGSYTTKTCITRNGINGILITSKSNGNSIFLPAAGSGDKSINDFSGYFGWFWSRSRNTNYSDKAYNLGFGFDSSLSSDEIGGRSSKSRYDGLSVRPVRTESNEYVDLGLPSGTLWAKCNIGANRPEEYGDCFAWGEIVPKDYYDWSTYKWSKNEAGIPERTLTKYCTQESYGWGYYVNNQTYINSFTDGISQLLPEDDAATVNWGSDWQIPSTEQFSELWNSNYTTLILTTQSGVYGCLVTSKGNGKTLFLPAAGYRYATSLYLAGSDGFYWSRAINADEPNRAYNMGFNSSSLGLNNNYRHFGFRVRPVRKQ